MQPFFPSPLIYCSVGGGEREKDRHVIICYAYALRSLVDEEHGVFCLFNRLIAIKPALIFLLITLESVQETILILSFPPSIAKK